MTKISELSPMKRQIIDIVSSDDEDFEDLGRPSGRVLQNPRVKRSLGLNFGGGSIQSGDTHRADSALPLSSSGVDVRHRRILTTSEWSTTVKWYPKVPTTKAWIERKLRAESEDMRMTSKPAGLGDNNGCWLFEVGLFKVTLICNVKKYHIWHYSLTGSRGAGRQICCYYWDKSDMQLPSIYKADDFET